jgi:hypothetical protein
MIAKGFAAMCKTYSKTSGAGRIREFGALSHDMTVRLLHNTVEVTEILPLIAMEHPSTITASAFGGTKYLFYYVPLFSTFCDTFFVLYIIR